MPLIEYPATTATVHIASWLWMNREALGSAWSRVSDVVASSLAAPRAEIHRLGSAIVSVHDNQTRVLGVLHEHSAKLDGIDAAVGGIASGQAALGHSLAVLQNLSMLTLGISAASSLILFRQFHALRAQVARIERTAHRIGTLIEAQQLGQLETGLNQLRDGMEDIQSDRAEQGRTSISHTAANNLALNVNQHAILPDTTKRASRRSLPSRRARATHAARRRRSSSGEGGGGVEPVVAAVCEFMANSRRGRSSECMDKCTEVQIRPSRSFGELFLTPRAAGVLMAPDMVPARSIARRRSLICCRRG